jgi:hypothetical protein
VLEQAVEALEFANLVISLGHTGSIADLDEMASEFAEISAGGAIISAVQMPPLRTVISAPRLNPDFYQQVVALPMSP